MAKKIGEYGENSNRKYGPPVAPAVAADFGGDALGEAK
jgi:hypothetical protein